VESSRLFRICSQKRLSSQYSFRLLQWRTFQDGGDIQSGRDGLTAEDIIEAISTRYGKATTPGDSVSVSDSTSYEDQKKVLARWENEQYSYNLYRSPYGNTFGLVAFSKMLDLMARNASREADRLETLEAPAKELALQRKRAEDARAAQETARSTNKPKFQP
jgi:hypothetical protein